MSQPVAWASEQLVNTETSGDQSFSKVVGLEGGGYVVVWSDASGVGGDADSTGIKAQLYDAGGTKVGGEILVNTYTWGYQHEPQVVALGGGFVVTWGGSAHPDVVSAAIGGQVFDAAGQKVGEEFIAFEHPGFGPDEPVLTALDGGDFAVAVSAYDNNTGDTSIEVQRFDAGGQRLGGIIDVNTTNDGDQTTPAIAAIGGGRFVVTWIDANSGSSDDPYGAAIRMRIYTDDGTPASGEMLVNTTTWNDQTKPAIAAFGDGNFIVTWRDDSLQLAGGNPAVIGQFFDATGGKVGSEFVIDDGTSNGSGPSTTAVVATHDGYFAVNDIYNNTADPGSTGVVGWAIPFDPGLDQAPAPAGIFVNQTTTGEQGIVAVSRLADGRVVITWTDQGGNSGDTSGSAVRMQIIDTRGGIITGTEKGEAIYGSFTGSAVVDDTIDGKGGNDTIHGLDGNDTINGGTGADTMYGGTGNDTYVVDDIGDKAIELAGAGIDLVESAVSWTLGANVERLTLTGATGLNGTGNGLANLITGNAGANILKGLGGNDRLVGAEGRDTLIGGAGGDKLVGGAGKDMLTGGAGRDAFVFDTALAGAPDRIKDFSHRDDTIHLDDAIFAAIGPTLTAGEFFIGAKAHDAGDRIIYNDKTGALIYDANGSKAGGAFTFAMLGKHLALDHTDFLVV